ncbi:MAG: orotate phosphoribosyltransferase, partial [Cyclobacteriaceae bacterium]
YCDNRLSLSYHPVRKYITQQLTAFIKSSFDSVEAVSGVATAGISQGALVADALELPFSYIRSSAKKHGMTNKIEGRVFSGDKTIVIEDLVSTGGSSIDAALALREGGVEILAIASIFTYGFPIIDTNLDKVNMDLFSLCDYDTLIEVALEKNKISSSNLENLKSWKNAPEKWGK